MKALVLGYGRVGRSISKVLKRDGFEVYVYDDSKDKKIEIEKDGLMFYEEEVSPDIVIKSPGIYRDHPLVKEVMKKGIEVMDEIEYVFRRVKNKIIAVTGTNGKSTTTAMLGEVFKKANKKVFVGGNLSPGRPFSESLLDGIDYEYYIIEVSTFQIEGISRFKPWIGVILNITQDHLDRHTLEEYIKLKFSLFLNSERNENAVLNLDDETTRRTVMETPEILKARTYWFSTQELTNGAHIRERDVFFDDEKVLSKKELVLRGTPYISNVLAVITTAKIAGIDNEIIKEGLKSFKGLPHRLEFVRELNTVKFYNNSMCTNPTAFYASIQSFSKKVIVIAGGKEKGLDGTPVIEGIRRFAKYAVLFGENSLKLKRILEEKGYHEVAIAESMEDAVKKAYKKATRDDIVLFSPGFASFDLYRNFEERGDVFKEAARKL